MQQAEVEEDKDEPKGSSRQHNQMLQQDRSSNIFPSLPAKRLAHDIDQSFEDYLLTNPADVTFTNIPAPQTMTQIYAPGKRKKVRMEPAQLSFMDEDIAQGPEYETSVLNQSERPNEFGRLNPFFDNSRRDE